MTDQELHRYLTELGFVIEMPVLHVWGTPRSTKTRRAQVERWVNFKFNLTRKRRTPKYPEFLSAFIPSDAWRKKHAVRELPPPRFERVTR